MNIASLRAPHHLPQSSESLINMADSVIIDMPMDGEEVVHRFHFQERTTLTLNFGFDKLGLEFGQDSTNTNTTNSMQDENNNTTTTTTTTSTYTTKSQASSSPSNSPIIRHKIEVAKNLNTRKSRPNLAAARRAHQKRFSVNEIYEDNREMDRLTYDFNSKVKLRRKKKIEMKTFKSNVIDI